MAVARVIPVAPLDKGCKTIYKRKERTEGKCLPFKNDNIHSGSRSSARLISNLGPWLNRNHGEIGHFISQLLSRHGFFQCFLHKIGKVRFLHCVLFNGEQR